jgi:hypothetical protein
MAQSGHSAIRSDIRFSPKADIAGARFGVTNGTILNPKM